MDLEQIRIKGENEICFGLFKVQIIKAGIFGGG